MSQEPHPDRVESAWYAVPINGALRFSEGQIARAVSKYADGAPRRSRRLLRDDPVVPRCATTREVSDPTLV